MRSSLNLRRKILYVRHMQIEYGVTHFALTTSTNRIVSIANLGGTRLRLAHEHNPCDCASRRSRPTGKLRQLRQADTR